MSLGIKSIWRVRPQHTRPLSLIPGDRSSFLLHQTRLTSPRAGVSARSQSTATTHKDAQDAQDAQDLQDLQDATPNPAALPASPPPPPMASTFIRRLASVPVRRHGPRQSVLIEPPTTYPHRRETHRSMVKGRRATTQQDLLERFRAYRNAPLPDWRLILWNLGRWTPEHSDEHIDDVIKVVISKDSANALLLDGKNSVWDIRTRTKCSMKMCLGNDKDQSPYLLLSGPHKAVSAAVQDILRVSKSATVVPLSSKEAVLQAVESIGTHPGSQSLMSILTRTPPSTVKPYSCSVRAQDIPRPGSWTSESFETYVATLVNGRMAPNLAAQLYRGSTSHQEAVINQLHQAFNDEATRQVLSYAAFKVALQYMTRQGVTNRPHARALYARMEIFGLRMDADIFNILAESAVQAKDLLFFDTVLRLMHRRGHAPNLGTWILFLRMIEAEEVKRYVLHAMDRKGLLQTPNAVQLVSGELVHADIERAIQQGKDLETFLADQARLYGPGWLVRPSLHKIIEVLGRHSRLEDALRVVDLMLSHDSCHPTTVTLNMLLTHCKIQNNLHGALQVLRKLGNHAATQADPITYHLLFEVAWRNKMPHTLGLVWRYACLVNGTSYRMRHRITSILRGRRGMSRITRQLGLTPFRDNVEAQAVVCAGLPLDSVAAMLLFREFMTSHDVEEATRMIRDDRAGAQFMASWYRSKYKDHKPACSLADLLSTALDRDARVHKDIKEGRSLVLAYVELPKTLKPEMSRSKASKKMLDASEFEEGKKLWVDVA